MGFKLKILRAVSKLLGHPRDPALAEWLGGGTETESGVLITNATALQSSAVYACVRNTAETMASIPCMLKRVVREGNRRWTEDAFRHPLYKVLLWEPNDFQSAFEFWEFMYECLELRGNFFARIGLNSAGQVVRLDPMNPDRTQPFWGPGRKPYYRYQPPDGAMETLLQREVFHVRGPFTTNDCLVGTSTIKHQKDTIGYAIGAQRYGSRLFKNDARPVGTLEIPAALKQEAYDRLKKGWKENYGGENQHGVAILEDGAKFNKIAMSNEDAQYLQSRGFTDLEIARIFRMPPYKIGILEKSTLNNVEQQNRAWVSDKLATLASRVEHAISRDLLTTSGKRHFRPRHDFAELLRGDHKVRSDSNRAGIQWGYLNRNDVREIEGRPPIGPAGDVYVTPGNMQAIDTLLSPPADPAGAGAGAD